MVFSTEVVWDPSVNGRDLSGTGSTQAKSQERQSEPSLSSAIDLAGILPQFMTNSQP